MVDETEILTQRDADEAMKAEAAATKLIDWLLDHQENLKPFCAGERKAYQEALNGMRGAIRSYLDDCESAGLNL